MSVPEVVVVGCGCVGEATARVLEASGIEVGRHDPARGLDLSAVSGPRVRDVMICLPTPGTADATPAELDCSAVESELRAWGGGCPGARLVVRSTVPPAFWERLPWLLRARCVHWPCFAEHWRIEEFERRPPFVVFGGEGDRVAAFRGEVLAYILRGWAREPSVVVCSLQSASWAKLATNALYAANVVLANELAALGERQGADWASVRRALDANPRLGDTFVVSDAGGYDGECLTKDVGQVAALADRDFTEGMSLLRFLGIANEDCRERAARRG